MGGRIQFIAMSGPPAVGRVPGIATILMIGVASAMRPQQEVVIRQLEHVTSPQNGRRIKDVTDVICLSLQMHDNSLNYHHH